MDELSRNTFRFDKNDFGTMLETTWRKNFQDAVTADLESRTGLKLSAWSVRAGYARVAFSTSDERRNFPFYKQPLLFFNVSRDQQEECSYGLWIMRPGAVGEWSDKQFESWGWDQFLGRLQDTSIRQSFINVLEGGEFEIWVDEMLPYKHTYYNMTAHADGLTSRDEKSGEIQELTWEQFFNYLSELPNKVTSRVEFYKTQAIASDLSVKLKPVIETLSSLAPFLSQGAVEGKGDLVLIGAAKQKEDGLPIHNFFKEHGKVASWWSYTIRKTHLEQLQTSLPITLYLYEHGGLFMECRVSEFMTTDPGPEGIVSPWPEFTIPDQVGKTRVGTTSRAEICKTWFLIDEITEIEPPLFAKEFRDYDDGKPVIGSKLRTSFGYARRGTAVPALLANPVYEFFHDRGFHFPNEVITDYFLSLKTKPFVILSGISGTGKTKIAQLFAEYMCPPEDIVVTEIPPFSDNAFFVRISKQIIPHGILGVRSDMADYIEWPTKGQRYEVTLEFGDKQAPAIVRNIGFSDPTMPRDVRLHFRKAHMDWIKHTFELGDVMKITVLDSDSKVYRLEKYEHPQKKQVKARRWAFISVRPDWTDGRGLLGFFNLLRDTYQPTELLKLMLRAKEDPGRPYFVILDEMNLAKVEYYFSDFLSCLESRVLDDSGGMRQEPVFLHDQPGDIEFADADGTTYYIPPSLEIPVNLYFTGTVNVDESTYMFSPKVLDRANTIEFNLVELESYGEGSSPSYGSDFMIRKEAVVEKAFEDSRLPGQEDFKNMPVDLREIVLTLNEILEEYHLHFGYRVANEIALYTKNVYEFVGPAQAKTGLDFQILQKVLPKFHGSRQRLEEPLLKLLAFCMGEELEQVDYTTVMNLYLNHADPILFPRSAEKVARMLKILADQGFVSFVE